MKRKYILLDLKDWNEDLANRHQTNDNTCILRLFFQNWLLRLVCWKRGKRVGMWLCLFALNMMFVGKNIE